MKNHNLYIQPPYECPEKKCALDLAIKAYPEYKKAVVDWDAPKAKRSDVPPMYRRSILADILKGILIVAFSASIINLVLFFATVL